MTNTITAQFYSSIKARSLKSFGKSSLIIDSDAFWQFEDDIKWNFLSFNTWTSYAYEYIITYYSYNKNILRLGVMDIRIITERTYSEKCRNTFNDSLLHYNQHWLLINYCKMNFYFYLSVKMKIDNNQNLIATIARKPLFVN